MGDTILEMKHVTKKFPGVIALNDVSINVKRGEVLGIVGENGAGKSTLMKVLSGSYTNKEYEGEIWVNGEKQSFASVSDAKKIGIEMVYQEVNAMYEASVAENIFVGNLPGKGWVDYKKLYTHSIEFVDEKFNIQMVANEIGIPETGRQKQCALIGVSGMNDEYQLRLLDKDAADVHCTCNGSASEDYGSG